MDQIMIIKELAEEFKKQFICLGENTEKYITFTVPIEKKNWSKWRRDSKKFTWHIINFW